MDDKKTLGVLLFPGFESLDAYGPIEMFGSCDAIRIITIAQSKDPVPSTQGPKTLIDCTLDAVGDLDWLLVPGGAGARREVGHQALLAWIRHQVPTLELVMSVCTGAAILAAAGILDGRSATTNKRAFSWVAGHGPKVQWIREARWVEDGQFATSSGVSAGMDMSIAIIKRYFGVDEGLRISQRAEYEPRLDSTDDPFVDMIR